MMKKSVVVGISGGIDSAVCAILLKEKNFELVGAMGIFTDIGTEYQLKSAESLTEELKIDLIIRNLQDKFKSTVIDYFADEYAVGRTPSPCILCNSFIKFKLLEEIRKDLSFDCIATGHYARTNHNKFSLMRGSSKRDQAYFLSRIDKKILKRTILPLGNMNKKEVKDKANDYFPGREWHSSMDICFIRKDYTMVVKERYPDAAVPGPILDVNGNEIGKHSGILNYTICQRKGINTSLNIPLYVKKIIPDTNTLIVGRKEECMVKSLTAEKPFWLNPPGENDMFMVQTYSTQKPFRARLRLLEDKFSLDFEKPQFHVTPGQLAVLYSHKAVIGSGWIV